MLKKITFIILLVGINFSAFASEDKDVPVRCTGDSVTYAKEENTIYGQGNVEIKYQGNYLRADKVKVNTQTKDAEAEGRVIISDGVNIFTGDNVKYNFETGRGTIDGLASRMGPWFARGEGGERLSADLYQIKNGYVTSCDYEKPHYRIKAKEVLIYPGNKVVAKNIVMYWGNLPVFYWPYFTKSLQDKRNNWTVIPGYNNKLGKFLLTGYSMWWDNFLGGRLKPTIKLDYYEKRGWATGVNAKYKYRDKIVSLIRGYIINDKGYKENGIMEEKTRGRFSMDYVQRITDDTRGLLELNILSDPDIIKDFFKDEFEDEIQTENYINIAKTTQWYQLSLMIKKRFHDFYTDLERLPELTFSVSEQRIGETNFLYTSTSSIGYLSQRFSETNGGEDYSAARFDTSHKISYPKKYFGWLNIIPRIGTRQTFWDKRAEWVTTNSSSTQTTATAQGAQTGTFVSTSKSYTGTSTTTTTTTTVVNPETTTITKDFSAVAKKELDINTWRSVYFTGAEFTTKISKVFDVKNSFWQINQLRHLIEPRADYVYQHEPTVQADDLLDFGDLDYKQNYIALGVRNKLQTKRETAWDLIDFWMGTNYYPRKYKDMPIASDRKFSNIYMDLRIIPFDWLEMDMYSYWDQYDKQIDTYSNDFVFYKNDKLSFGIGYRYQRAQDKLWTSEINYTINSNWALRLVHWFEFETGQLQQQEYVLVRDLHCWNLAFSFRKYHNTDETAGFVVLYPKAYPDMPITFGTTYFGANDTAEVDFGMD